MTLFVTLSAVMVLLAMVLVVWPLWRGATRARAAGAQTEASLTVLADEMRELQRQLDAGSIDPADFEGERAELERQALQAEALGQQQVASTERNNRAVAALLAVVLPLAAVGVYSVVGTPAGLDVAALQQPDMHESGERAIAALERRLAAQPDDLAGWVLLGRSYAQLNQLDNAVRAYKRAVVIDGDEPDLLIEYANVLAMSRDRNLTGEPEQLVQHALELDPHHVGALTFAGLAAFQHDQPEQALDYWHQLVSILPEDSESRQRVQALIDRTEAQLAGGPGAAAASAATISGRVALAPELADQVGDGDTLYVFARAPSGPPMPLAAVRARAADWPVAFTLDDSSAMMEDLKLSSFEQVDVIARISRQGNPTAQAGDLEGILKQVPLGSHDVAVTIDRVVED